ncbi:MAG: hypothetical protein AB2L20_07530 [Mangrovibacterium sp.]
MKLWRFTLMVLADCLFTTGGFAQGYLIVNDPHITAQENRMVITGWGNFLPKPKYFLGVQTSVHYMLTWGSLAPAQNGRYRKGSDIRPLAPIGEQTQRMLLNTALLKTNKTYREYVDSLRDEAVSELAYQSGLLSGVDPLWVLYYKAELKGVRDFDIEAVKADLSRQETQYLDETGILEWFEVEMLVLKDRLSAACNTDMDRGSRILAYHRTLLDYRALVSKWNTHLNWADKILAFRNLSRSKALKDGTAEFSWTSTGDADRMREVIKKAKTTY